MEGRREREKVERGYPNPTLSATSVRDLLDNHSKLAEFYKFRLQHLDTRPGVASVFVMSSL